ncbi:chorion peroxidase-like, partial [Nilaparvata lugens]|uniref:chorion peroxidase-like n=1 Tax=Nilaparvata lugens TaxID=108931 RepID=UPI00193E40E8
RPYKPPQTHFQSDKGMNIAGVCAPPVDCNINSKYRTITGACNNKVQVAAWGLSNTALNRLLPADFSDGISAPRKMSNGKPLPSARLLRTLLFPIDNCPSHINAELLLPWGGAIAHDTSHVDPIGLAQGLRLQVVAVLHLQVVPVSPPLPLAAVPRPGCFLPAAFLVAESLGVPTMADSSGRRILLCSCHHCSDLICMVSPQLPLH